MNNLQIKEKFQLEKNHRKLSAFLIEPKIKELHMYHWKTVPEAFMADTNK